MTCKRHRPIVVLVLKHKTQYAGIALPQGIHYLYVVSSPVSDDYQLVFSSVSKEDNGDYKCLADNGYKSTVNSNTKVISVSVECK